MKDIFDREVSIGDALFVVVAKNKLEGFAIGCNSVGATSSSPHQGTIFNNEVAEPGDHRCPYC